MMENLALTVKGVNFILEPKDFSGHALFQIERKNGEDKLTSLPIETTKIHLQNFTGVLTVSSFLDVETSQKGLSQNSRRPTPSPSSSPVPTPVSSSNETRRKESSSDGDQDSAHESHTITPKRSSKASQYSPAHKKRNRIDGLYSTSLMSEQNFPLGQHTQDTQTSLCESASKQTNPTLQSTQNSLEQDDDKEDCDTVFSLSSESYDRDDNLTNTIVEEDYINLNSVPSPLSTVRCAKETMPCGRWGHTLTMIDKDCMILYGGQCVDKNDEFETLSSLFVFNITKRTWKEPVTNNSNLSRCWHTSNFLPERNLLIIIGGESAEKLPCGKERAIAEVMALDTEIMLWYPPIMIGTVPKGRSGHTSSYLPLSDSLLVFGGVKKKWLNTFSVLDINRWKWTVPTIVGNPPQPRSYHTATVIEKDSTRIVVFGGNDKTQCFNSVHVLEQISNENYTWSHPNISGQAPTARTGHVAVLLHDQTSILIYGGWDPKEEEASLFQDCFILDTLKWRWITVKNDVKYWHGFKDNGGARSGHSIVRMPVEDVSCEQDILFFGGRLPNDKFADDFQILQLPKDLYE